MIHLKYFVLALFFLLQTLSANAQQNYDVYIGAGQSNFDGRGLVSELTGELSSYAGSQVGTLIYYNNPPEPDPDEESDQPVTSEGFQTLEPGYSVTPALFDREIGDVFSLPSESFGPEVSFALQIATSTGSDNPIAIIKVARGGTNLDRDWRAADSTVSGDTGGPLYAALLDTIDEATAELIANGDTFTIRGFIWHQGESDDNNAVAGTGRAGRYLENFSAFVDGVRAHVGNPALPFVIGELAQGRTSSNNDAFRAIQLQVANTLDRVGFVSSVGLQTPASTGAGNDATHFDAASQIELGLRYATELASLINNVEPPASEVIKFDLDNELTPGLEPLGVELDSLDEPDNPVDSPSTATLAGITFVATATTDIVDATPSDPTAPSGATFNAAGQGAGVNSIGGSADGDGGAAFVDPGEELTLTLDFDESTTTVALTEITFRNVGGMSDSATISIAGGPTITLFDDISDPAFTFTGGTFTLLTSAAFSSGDTIVFTNVAAGSNYQVTGFSLEIGTPTAGLTGDFDGDDDVDIDDINHFAGNIGTAATGLTLELDFTGDGQITLDDLQFHVENYVQTSNNQTGTFLGDLNLDGSVNVLGDAFILIGNLNRAATSYGQGDTNLNGTVNVLGDAFTLIGNLNRTNEP